MTKNSNSIYTLGIDIGSSSVKVALLDTDTGLCVAAHNSPDTEMPISSTRPGWAEQEPELWWKHVTICLKEIFHGNDMVARVAAIGITYQMHGLVCIDSKGVPLRNSIIWCDSRAVGIGERYFRLFGEHRCLFDLLNSPGNFTTSKLRWVREHEPEIFRRIYKIMLPGDYIMYRLTGEIRTTESGLSEQILWNFREGGLADFVLDGMGIERSLVPEHTPSIGIQALTSAECEKLFGIREGTPVSYKAGDQPNNAFSLNVMEPGEVAATGGTSGVVYGVSDRHLADPLFRVNSFVHVNNTPSSPRTGVLLCINGTGIMNAWARRILAPELTYDQINELCTNIPAGSEGVSVLPFGNGAERMLNNRYTGVVINGVDLNRHSSGHLLRASQEGIAFAFRYGMEIMEQIGIRPKLLKAGMANLFLSPLFRETLSTIANVQIELYNTDGALGAARGAALGAGIFTTREETFRSLTLVESICPNSRLKSPLDEAYQRWKKVLETNLNNEENNFKNR